MIKPRFLEKISIAPMMDYSNRHFRYFMRLLSKHTVLYTEMVVADAIIHGDRDRFLQFNEQEHPVVLQLGGSNPDNLAQCAKIAEQYGYDAINLNIGCPSDRVQRGKIGACLMAEPMLVGNCIAEMNAATNLPVTVKTRLGIDHQDSFQFLTDFVGTVSAAGCETFIIHARKAWLQGLSPKENRTKPPINYQRVYDLKKQFPQLQIIINGEINSHDQIDNHLQQADGVMLGRIATQQPYFFADVDQKIFGETAEPLSRISFIESYLPYLIAQREQGVPLMTLLKPLWGLFQGVSGAKRWRQLLTQGYQQQWEGDKILLTAIADYKRRTPCPS